MHVARVRKTIKGKTYESALLRQSYRQGQQVKHRTLASLTALPPHVALEQDQLPSRACSRGRVGYPSATP